MIQLGPVQLDSVTVERPVGIKTGSYQILSTGEEKTLQKAIHTLRLRVRIEKDDKAYRQLVELVRNKYLAAMPLSSGYRHIDGLYVITGSRESAINWFTQEISIILERIGKYISKNHDTIFRYDEWNTIYQEDFSSFSNMINEYVAPGDGAVVAASTVSPVVGDNHGSLTGTGAKRVTLFGFDYWTNYHFSAWVQSTTAHPFGIVWRAESGNLEGWDDTLLVTTESEHRGLHYEMQVDPSAETFTINYYDSWDEAEDTPEIIYTETHDDLLTGQWYHFRVISIRYYHFCFLNGRLVTYFKDKRCRGGRVGIIKRHSGSSAVYFDNVIVQEVPDALLVIDEGYAEPDGEIIKQRDTLHGTIAYCEDTEITYRVGSGGPNCILNLRFDQPYGEKVFDLSSYKNHAKVVGGEWKSGYMRFYAGKKGLVIPYHASMNEMYSEGTIIFRMRKRIEPTSDECIFRRGDTDHSIYLDGSDNLLHVSSEEPGTEAAGYSPFINVPDLNPDFKWRTYVVRWHKVDTSMDIFVDGLLGGVDAAKSQTFYGANTLEDMRIGESNVDIAFILVYDKYMEQPRIPTSIGVGIYDVDSHHEDEIFDVRLTEEDNGEFWSDAVLTENGTPVPQYSLHKPLLHRRNAVLLDTANTIEVALPDHIKNQFHNMDWTIELVWAGNDAVSVSDDDILTISDAAFTNKTIRIFADTPSLFQVRRSIITDSGTETITIKEYTTDESYGLQIIHLTYRADSKELRCFFHGTEQSKVILADDITSSNADILRIGVAQGLYYRIRIIGVALKPKDISRLAKEYEGKPVQVFSEHEFEGYPELNNGLFAIRSAMNPADDQHGESMVVEIFDDGTFVPIRGRVSGTEKAVEILHLINDDEGSDAVYSGNVHGVTMWDMQPIISVVDHDEVTVELRNQVNKRNVQVAGSGVHIKQEISLSTGLFAMDTYARVTSRTQNWELRFRYTDMNVCWREGGHSISGTPTELDVQGNFWGASGNTSSFNMPSQACIPHLSNFSILMNINQTFHMGLLPGHTDDYLSVEFLADATYIDRFWFDSLQQRLGGEFRVAIGFIPYSGTIFDDPNTSDWTVSNLTQAANARAWNNLNLREGGTATIGSAYKSLTMAPGTWQAWWGLMGFGDAGVSNVAFSVYESGSPDKFRNRRLIDFVVQDETHQLYHDMPFVVNGIVDLALRFEIRLELLENQNGTYYIDGLSLMPCFNGADFILDQIYAARTVKNIRRLPK